MSKKIKMKVWKDVLEEDVIDMVESELEHRFGYEVLEIDPVGEIIQVSDDTLSVMALCLNRNGQNVTVTCNVTTERRYGDNLIVEIVAEDEEEF